MSNAASVLPMSDESPGEPAIPLPKKTKSELDETLADLRLVKRVIAQVEKLSLSGRAYLMTYLLDHASHGLRVRALEKLSGDYKEPKSPSASSASVGSGAGNASGT